MKSFLKAFLTWGGEFYWYVNFNKLSFDQDNLTKKNEPVLKNLIKYLSENKYFHFSKLMNMGDYYRSIKDYNQAISYYDQAEKHANQKIWIGGFITQEAFVRNA